jgi:hypothetical protein
MVHFIKCLIDTYENLKFIDRSCNIWITIIRKKIDAEISEKKNLDRVHFKWVGRQLQTNNILF